MLFGSSGIRRVMNSEAFEFFSDVSKAVGTFFPEGAKLAVGCDTRLTSEKLKSSVISSLLSTGIDVIDVGTVPTPILAFTSKMFDGGVMVTASHNPKEYNGIKIFGPIGLGLQRREQEKIEKIFSSKSYRAGHGSESRFNPIENYTESIGAIGKRIGIRKDLKILLDPGNGAMSILARKILSSFGMNVESINDEPDGSFPNRPSEPKEETLSKTIELSKNYDFAACFDGDGDRVVFCDGRFFGYNEGMAAVAKFYGARKVVTTVESGMLLDTVAEVIRVAVGDVNVAEAVMKYNADLGVEQVGHYIFPELGPFPETLLPVIIFASRFEERNFEKKYFYVKKSFKVNDKFEVMNKLKPILMKMGSKRLIDVDGLRLEFEDSWVLIRPSGTEPIIRVFVEAETEERKNALLNEMEKIVRSVI